MEYEAGRRFLGRLSIDDCLNTDGSINLGSVRLARGDRVWIGTHLPACLVSMLNSKDAATICLAGCAFETAAVAVHYNYQQHIMKP